MTRRRAGTLLLTRNFPPMLGGMERLNLRLAEALLCTGPLRVIGPKGASGFLPPEVDVTEVPARGLVRFLWAMAVACLLAPWRGCPQIVIAGSGLTAPFAWVVARSCGARCAAYLHGLDIVVPSRVYQLFWLPFIRRCDMLLVNSRHVAGLATAAGVPVEKIRVINPGADVPVLDASANATFRQRHGLEGRRILLSVGRITPRKGLLEFIADVLPGVVEACPEVCLIVIGGDAKDALHAPGLAHYKTRIDSCIAANGLLPFVSFLPNCDDAELSEAYQAADVHIFPVREIPGDVEGFGMVAIESAMHGLSTVAYAVGGVPDAVLQSASGLLVPPNDDQALANAVLSLLENPLPRNEVRKAALRFSWPRFQMEVCAAIEALHAA